MQKVNHHIVIRQTNGVELSNCWDNHVMTHFEIYGFGRQNDSSEDSNDHLVLGTGTFDADSLPGGTEASSCQDCHHYQSQPPCHWTCAWSITNLYMLFALLVVVTINMLFECGQVEQEVIGYRAGLSGRWDRIRTGWCEPSCRCCGWTPQSRSP